MKDLSLLTWKEIKQIEKNNSIVFVTAAPIEEHSLCLPLATDLIEGKNWSMRAMEILERGKAYQCFFLPPFPVAAASVNDFYGCIHFSMKTTYHVVKELLDSLVNMGFFHIVVIASHADPDHQIAVEKAIDKINKHYGIRAISPMGAFFSADELKLKRQLPDKITQMECRYPNDFHAGWIETSSILAINKTLVREGYEKLPPSNITDKDMISKKKQFQTMGEYGHLGNPAGATKELGELLNQDASEFIAEAVLAFVKRKNYKQYMHHFLYRILFLKLGLLKNKGFAKKGVND